MTKKRSTRRALALSFVSLLLCVSMFVGTTFAWFTDSVSSTNNIIKAGNLDVELYYMNDETADWTKVTSATNIFKKDTLWEPGHTEVVKLKVVNEGTLALKYNLGVNIASETGSKNVLGDMFKLSDYIKYGVVEGEQNYTRDTAIAAVEDTATRLNITYSKNGELASKAENVVTMVVYMPTTVGNEANYAKDAAVPTINLGINLFATQVEAENDSFGNDYDANAPFSVWNGVVPTEMPESLVVDGATQTVHVKDAAAFAYLSTLSAKWAELYTDGNGRTYTNYANGAGADYYYSGKWTVSLEADIDLGNHAIAPVNIVLGESTGASAFNGNGHTIRNINTTTGLFADKARVTFSNINLVNVKATNGALIGSSDNDISNVIVQNATISGVDYVGGLVGYTYGAVNGCKVIDSSVVASGKEAGGLIGYVVTSREEATVANNVVKNVSVYANNRAAGLAAQVNVKVKVYNNIIDTVTVGVEDASKYQAGAVVSNALAPENVYDNEVKNANVYAEVVVLVEDDASVRDALKNDTIVVLTKDVITTDAESNGYGATGFNVNGGVLDGNGKTIEVEGATSTWDSAIAVKGGTIKNVTVAKGFRGIFVNGATEKVVLENVVVDGPVYTISCDSSGKHGLEATNCVFNGWTSYAATLGDAKFVNCSFGKGAGYNFSRPYAPTVYVNCNFEAGHRIDARAAVTLTNCYLDGVLITAENVATLVTNNTANATVLND